MSNMNRSTQKAGFTSTEKISRPLQGIYIGEVINSRDASFTGRIRVFIPELGKDRRNTAGHFDCLWSSPFAGATNQRNVGENITRPEDSMQSYGLWMVPPDAGNQVIVGFIDGDARKGVILSTLFADRFNWSIPGYAAGRTYASPEVPLPSTEKNKRVNDINHDDTTRPVHYEIAESITRQGLIRDSRRGTGNSTARRESPSQVFGLLTPGPREQVGSSYRVGGHQLIFDDNLDNRMIRIRTAKGQQLLFDDNAGTIYAINRDGEAWWEMDKAGNFTVFGEGSINLRAKQDFNLRADKDINIEAGGDIKIKAAGDMASRERGSEYVGPNTMGEEPAGYGGSVLIEGARHVSTHASLNHYVRAQSGSLFAQSQGDMHLHSYARIHELGDAGINLSSNQDIGIGANGQILVQSSDDTVVQGAKIRLNSGGASPQAAEAAEQAPDIPVADAEDQPLAKPEFQRDPENALPGGGRRPGEVTRYSTIVGAFATAEPYVGHNHFDPTSEDIGTIDSDETIVRGLPAGSNGGTDRAGNLIRNDLITPDGAAIAVAPAQGSGSSFAGIGNLPPDMQQITDSPLGNFDPGTLKQVSDMPVFDELSDTLATAIPGIAGQARDLAGNAVTGIGRRLSEVEAQLGAVMVNAQGFAENIVGSVGEQIMNAVTNIRNNTGIEGFDPAAFLEENGLRATQDGLSTIYSDAAGNKIIDLQQGAGPAAAKLMQTAELRTSAASIKDRITAPISDNQLAALSSFAAHIGESNFARSGIAEMINSGNYSDVPREMSKWSVGVRERGGEPQSRDDYLERRRFEGELFTSPDGIELPVSTTRLTFEQLRQRLRGTKDSFYQQATGPVAMPTLTSRRGQE